MQEQARACDFRCASSQLLMVRAFGLAWLRQIAQSRSVRMREVGRDNFKRLRLRRRQLATLPPAGNGGSTAGNRRRRKEKNEKS